GHGSRTERPTSSCSYTEVLPAKTSHNEGSTKEVVDMNVTSEELVNSAELGSEEIRVDLEPFPKN
ncbi:8735_t:CDS:1, partial [Gigaspora rosea]